MVELSLVKVPLGKCHKTSLNISQHWLTGNGLRPTGYKPLPEQMLTMLNDAICFVFIITEHLYKC